jgi:uncharacterized protein
VKPEVERIIRALGLTPHPEGGFFREAYRAALLPDGPQRERRSAATAIYFLIPAGTFSAFHRVAGADELWHHYAGDPVELHTLEEGEHRVALLGSDLEAGERPQRIVPAGVLQAARVQRGEYALCGCTVAPGFEFTDLTIPARGELLAAFPQHQRIIRELTRE